MNQYKSLLILGISLNLLTGCTSYLEDENLNKETPHETCNVSHYLIPTHLKASRNALKTLEVERISQTLSEQKSLIKYVIQRCEEENIPRDLALIPVIDSHYNPRSNHEGSAGIWQLNSVMAQNLSLPNNYWFDARKDIVLSTDAVISYIKYLHYRLDQDWTLALVAYHVGLQPVLDAVDYAKSIGKNPTLNNLELDNEAHSFLENLQGVIYLAQHTDILSADSLHIISLPGQIEIEKLSEVSGISIEKIEYLNAGFKRPITSPDGPHRIVVDTQDRSTALSVTKNMDKLRRISKSNWNHHVVKKDESLSLIAHRFETSITELKRVNNLTNDIIHINQRLIIPDTSSHPTPNNIVPLQNDHPGPQRILHTVTPHDTLYHISGKYHVSINAISHWNNLKNNAIQPNQTLTIWKYTPVDTAKFYTVKPDDSLSKIARTHKVSILELKKANHLETDTIHPNDRLLIPGH